MSQGNFYSNANGYNAKQLNVETGTMSKDVVFAGFKFGKHTVTAAQQTAGSAVINTGITIGGAIVQVIRANVVLGSADVRTATTNITVATNSTNYVVTEGDVISWVAWTA